MKNKKSKGKKKHKVSKEELLERIGLNVTKAIGMLDSIHLEPIDLDKIKAILGDVKT